MVASTAGLITIWKHREQIATIERFARNSCSGDERQFFEYVLGNSAEFAQLVACRKRYYEKIAKTTWRYSQAARAAAEGKAKRLERALKRVIEDETSTCSNSGGPVFTDADFDRMCDGEHKDIKLMGMAQDEEAMSSNRTGPTEGVRSQDPNGVTGERARRGAPAARAGQGSGPAGRLLRSLPHHVGQGEAQPEAAAQFGRGHERQMEIRRGEGVARGRGGRVAGGRGDSGRR